MATADETDDTSTSGGAGFPVQIFFEDSDETDKKPGAQSGGRGLSRGRSRSRTGRGFRGRGRGRNDFSVKHSASMQDLTHENDSEQSRNRDSKDTADQSRGTGSRSRGKGRAGRRNFGLELRSRDPGSEKPDTLGKRYSSIHDLLSLDQEQKVDSKSEKVKRHREFTEKDLVILSKKDNPDEVLLDVGNSRSGFTEFLRKKLDADLVYYVVRLLCKVSNAKMMTLRREILQEVEQNFLYNLIELLNLVSLKDPKTFKVWNSHGNLSKLLGYVIRLLSVIITTLPSSLGKCKGVITAVKEVIEEHDVEGLEEAIGDVEEVLKREKEVKTKSREEELLRSGRIPTDDQVTEEPAKPPDDFRSIPVFPTQEDLKEDTRPFLRAIREEGIYEDLDNYLDVQFRLLREDYIQPLRKGITDYKRCIREGIAVKRLRDIRLYHGVQVLYPVCSPSGINHVLQFDFKHLKNVNWVSTRRLLYGSLVCLSKDNFETLYYATITEREPEDLSQGNIQVHFENKSDIQNIQPRDVFIMAETTAYFEAYRYVLEGLKEMNEKMPLQRYIVAVERLIQPPAYLQDDEHTSYDFSCLVSKELFAHSVPVLCLNKWPSAEELQLDTSQYAALQQAVTKELAVIQGPPGTGKTFVGLKIVELLLNNFCIWADEKKRYPVLVVCYTNHALDQFLEGVLQYCEGTIIRIGGRCKSEKVQQFNLRNVKLLRREEKMRTFSLTQSEKDCREELKKSEAYIERYTKMLKKTLTVVIPYNELSLFMNEGQRRAFEFNRSAASMSTCISEWIGISEKEEALSDKLPLEKKFQKVWECTILQTVKKMQEYVRESLTDLWELDTRQRAELYNVWIEEWSNGVQENVNQEKRTKSSDQQSLLLKSQKSVLDFETLLMHMTSTRSIFEMQSLLAGRSVALKGIIAYWLNLTGSKKSIPFIQKAMESLQNVIDTEKMDDDEDVEEERQLDEEEDYYSKKKRKNKEKEKAEEWLEKVNNRQTSYRVKMMLSSSEPVKDEEAERLIDVWNLSIGKRCELYAYWVACLKQLLAEKIKEQEEIYSNAAEKLKEVRDHETVEILREADVIGMTTTGAAKYRTLLKHVGPKIVVVEEAAEVLESHIVTTLNENCQHLILIGDHKQLRPSTTVYELSKKYKMDVSLFERMVRNGVPCVTLEEQHRMRPEISCLLQHELLYPTLRDHESVKNYESIKGLDVNLQFIDHEEPEEIPEDSTSHRNQHEALYIAALSLYLINQGYDPSQITVLSPYMAQVLLLRQVMPKSRFDGIRITAVDNFQGEENDIILLSLVRSTTKQPHGRNTIGFVGIENRICVSLSRAKRGLFVLGNFGLLEEKSILWHDIIHQMRMQDALKPELTLRCSNHLERFVLAAKAVDFEKCPNGGCGVSCGAELPCGHVCPKSCHPVDPYHERATCERPCERIVCELGHKCTKSCWKPCGECLTIVEKELPQCGHIAWMNCYRIPATYKCTEICTYVLPCGHECKRNCFQCTEQNGHNTKCTEEVEKVLPCGHISKVECSEVPKEFQCSLPCTATLACGHKCSGNCGLCFGGKIHAQCSGTCKKVLPCGHICSHPCSEICPPCTRQCAWECSHRLRCDRKCWEECTKCEDYCNFYCKHNRRRCERDCFMKCDVVCRRPCRKRLPCSHFCIGACGEKCLCVHCNLQYLPPTFWERFHPKSIFIKLPDCGCVLELRSLDKYMDSPITMDSDDFVKKCPRCSTPIKSHIRRYTNIQKQLQAMIHDKYKTLMKSPESAESLKREVSSLSFLSTREAVNLYSRIDKCTKNGMLSTMGLVIQNLKKLAEVDPNIDDEVLKVSGLLNPQALKNLIMKAREFPAKQFWRDVEKEINRLPSLKAKHKEVDERLKATKMKRRESPVLDVYKDMIETIAKSKTGRKKFGENDEALLAALLNKRPAEQKMKQEKTAKRATQVNSAEQYDSPSAPAKRTAELELALGSDSIGSVNSTSAALTSKHSASQNYLLGSDSLDT